MQLPQVDRFPDQSPSICAKLANNIYVWYAQHFRSICKLVCDNRDAGFYKVAVDLINQLRFRQANGTFTRYENTCFQFLINNLISSLAYVASSYCIQTGQAVPREVWQLYSETLDTDVASSRLKLASMLYCMGDLQRSAIVLNDFQQRLDDSVTFVCGCRPRIDWQPSEAFCEYALRNGNLQTITRKNIFFVCDS